MRLLVVAIIFAMLLPLPQASSRTVAITIDDLPRGGDGGPRDLSSVLGMTVRLLRPFREGRIPVMGFVNARPEVALGEDGLRQVLNLWLDSGADLGNHSYSHPDINSIPLEQYTADITRGEPMLRAALAAHGRTLRYYRHPFLHTGATPDNKRGLRVFLDAHGYRVAPVTLDNSDYQFAAHYTKPADRNRVRREYILYMESVVAFFERRALEVVGRDISQILLVHASELNADLMPELLDMFRRRGYAFVSLDEALADPAYRLPEDYVGRGGFSWIHRWSMTKQMTPAGEPDPPQWIQATP
jgi:peptidoglycan/xylan/chitin deacetylase (PgdA/CDA1 family)